MKVLATYNIKGGVGKTSAAVNIAALGARDGLRTLLWDLDPQGAASFLFRVRPKVKGGGRKLVRGRTDIVDLLRGTDVEGLDLLPADFSYRHMDLALDDSNKPTRRLGRVLEPVSPHYDLAVLDCPPSISLVSESVFEAADTLLVPLIPSTLTMRTFEQLDEFVGERVSHPPEIVAFFSMVDRRKRLHRQVVESFPADRNDVARTAIPAATEVELMGVRRAPVVVDRPHSRAGRAYQGLWAEVRGRLKLGPGGRGGPRRGPRNAGGPAGVGRGMQDVRTGGPRVPSPPGPEPLDAAYRRLRPSLVRLAYLLTGSEELAEDVVHDAVVAASRRWDGIDDPGPYLRRAVVNRARSAHRSRGRERAKVARLGGLAAPPALQPAVDETWAVLRRLPDRQRQALVLRFYEDLPDAEIARLLGCRPATVRSLVHRGLAAIREVLR